MLPQSSCTIAAVRMICEPCECCVQPSAYRIVITLSGAARRRDRLATLRNASFGVPQIFSTISGV